MDGSRSNDVQGSSSSCGMPDQQSYGIIPSWEEILDTPVLHPEQEYQLSPHQHQYANLQNTQPCSLYSPGQLHSTDEPVSFHNQLDQYDPRHENLQNTQPSVLCPPIHLPPAIRDSASFQNQGHLHSGMMYQKAQHPVSQQQYQQHSQQQTYQQQLQPRAPLQPVLPALPHSPMSMPVEPLSISEARKLVDHKLTESNTDEIKKQEMREFAENFRKRRKLLGISQKVLSWELRKLTQKEFNEEHISFFENVELSFQDMCKFKPLLEHWMESILTSLTFEDAPEISHLKFKKVIFISRNARMVLRESFQKNRCPCVEEIERLAKSLNMDKISVILWFYNKRRKMLVS